VPPLVQPVCYILFPLTRSPELARQILCRGAVAADRAALAPSSGFPTMTVLIIDDEPGLRQTVSLILSGEGYEVHAASDGEEGLARARELQPDIILCDVRMPRLPGMEFLKRYREQGGNGLVIVMTAYGSTELAIEAM